MNLFNKQKNAALATALIFCGVNAAGERNDVRHALKEVRNARQAHTASTSDVPALISIMGEPMPHASIVAPLLRPQTPTSVAFVNYLTEPNVDVALTDAALLVDELFKGDATAKLLLINASKDKLAENSIYDIPMRARVAYLDVLIRNELHKDTKRTLTTGNTIIFATATGIALASGFKRGPAQLAEVIRDANWKGLARDAQVTVEKQADAVVGASLSAATESAATSRSFASRAKALPGALFAKFLPSTSRPMVQADVNALLESVAVSEPALVTAEVRSALKLKSIGEPRNGLTDLTASRISDLSISLEEREVATGMHKRLLFAKQNGNKRNLFVSDYMEADTAEALRSSLLSAEKSVAFNADGSVRAASAELTEALQPVDETVAAAQRKAAETTEKVGDTVSDAADTAIEALGDAKDKVVNAAENATEKAGEAVEQVADKAADVAQDVANKVEQAADTVTDKAGQAADATADAAQDAADKTGQAADKAVKKASTAAKKTAAATEATAEDVKAGTAKKPRSRRTSTAKSATTADADAPKPRTKRATRAQTSDTGVPKDDKIVSEIVNETGAPAHSPAAEKTGDVVESTGEVIGDATAKTGEVVGDATEATGEAIASVGGKIRSAADKFGASISTAAKDAGKSVKSTLTATGARIDQATAATTAKASAVRKGVRETTAKAGEELGARVEQTRAALKSQFNDFDRTAAFRDGTLVAAPALAAWNVGYAYGFGAGEDQSAFGLDDQLPSELLHPVPVEGAEQNSNK